MSLVEVAVALVLTGSALSAVAGAGVAAARLARRAQVMSTAVAHAAGLADSLAAAGAPAADSVRRAGLTFHWSVASAGSSGLAHIVLRVTAGERDTLSFPFVAGPTVRSIE